jgi:hypothetical protein
MWEMQHAAGSGCCLAMLVPQAMPSGGMSHWFNPDRQQAGSYKGLRTSATVNGYVTLIKSTRCATA